MKKRFLALFMVLAMITMMALAGCSGTEAPAESTETPAETPTEGIADTGTVNMWDGYYTYVVPDMNILSFVRFNEDGTYFANYFDNAALDAGTYEVLDKQKEYYEDTDGDGAANTDNGQLLTADKVVALTSYVTGQTLEIAYVDDTLMDMDMGSMAHHRNMRHDASYPYDPAVDEDPITVAEYYANGSTGDTISFAHDGSFVDATGDVMRFGMWTASGATAYALTYDDGASETITFSDDRSTATLTNAGADVALVAEIGGGPVEQYFLNGAFEVAHPDYGTLSYELKGALLGDGTVTLDLIAYGNAAPLDAGTWAMAENGYTINFVFDNAGELSTDLDFETYVVSLHYVLTGSEMGDIDTVLTLEANAAAAEATVEHTLSGSFEIVHETYGALPYDIAGYLYSDGTVKLDLSAYGNASELDAGTWAMAENGYTINFVFDKAGEMSSELNFETYEITLHYVLTGTESGDIDAVLTLNAEA